MSLTAESPYAIGTILALQLVCGVPHLTAFSASDHSARGWMSRPLYSRPDGEVPNQNAFLEIARTHARAYGFDVQGTQHLNCLFAAELIAPS